MTFNSDICNVQVVGLPWYEEASYQAVTALMDDAYKLFGTYAAWHLAAQRTEDEMSRKGKTTIRVTLDLLQFPAWCTARGLRLNAESRIDYAAHVARQMHTTG